MQAPLVEIDLRNVNLASQSEVRYWCAKFDCTAAELEKAVNVVGRSTDAVERILDIDKQFEPTFHNTYWSRAMSL